MKIALIAPPFIAVPPKKYGGTELFIAELASGLQRRGISVTLYTNGDSTVPVEKRWIFENEDWPISDAAESSLKGLTHSSWAIKEASKEADLIHTNDAPSLSFSRFVDKPFAYTVHHVFDPNLNQYYNALPEHIYYAAISDFQRCKLVVKRTRTIHHGIDIATYGSFTPAYTTPTPVHTVGSDASTPSRATPISARAGDPAGEKKRQYLVFLGRVAPPKGTHLAIEIAQQAGIPLKIAGEIQPLYRDYWEKNVKPRVDGKFIEYIGEVAQAEKKDLLENALAMLFPIQWDEPFGLVLVESMACGTPVLAMPGGSVEEILMEGISGHIRKTVEELADCAKNLNFDPKAIRDYAQQRFSADRMADNYIQLYSEAISQYESEPSRVRIVA